MLNCDMENEGLDALLVGLKFPAYKENPFFKELYKALSIEWASRKAGESNLQQIELPLSSLSVRELKEAAGFMYGLACSLTLPDYLKTFGFCFIVLQGLGEEIEFRSVKGQTIQ